MAMMGESSWRGMRLSVLAVLAVLAGGVALGGLASRRTERVAYTHEPGVVIVRLQMGGGMVQPLVARQESFPPFTLYGDGTTIYRVGSSYFQGRLDEAAIQRLLGLAVEDVRFFDLAERIGPVVYDAGSTGMRVNAAGRDHTVSMSSVGGENDADVRRLERLVTAIDALRTGADPAYVPAVVLLFAQHDPAGSGRAPGSAVTPWPLAEINLEQIYKATWETDESRQVTGAAATAALQAATAPRPFTQAGQRYLVVAVPTVP